MANSSQKIQKLLSKTKESINKSTQLKKTIAQIEASLSSNGNQKFIEKPKEPILLCQEVSNL